MPKFYFTYGTEGQPFHGGWTEVEAPSIRAASYAFRAFHPDKTEGILNCCDAYTEEQFQQTSMYGPGGNFGHRCHETIVLRHEIHANQKVKENDHESNKRYRLSFRPHQQ